MLILENLLLGRPFLNFMCHYITGQRVFFLVLSLVLVGQGPNEEIIQFPSAPFSFLLVFELCEQETTVTSK